MAIDIREITKIGENDHGYWFGVGKLGGRWVGFAMGDLGDGNEGMFLLPMSESFHLGLTDRVRAVKLTGAIAESSSHGYGGIARWFVEEELRGKPEEFTCLTCGEVACPGDCVVEFYDADIYA